MQITLQPETQLETDLEARARQLATRIIMLGNLHKLLFTWGNYNRYLHHPNTQHLFKDLNEQEQLKVFELANKRMK